MSNFSELMPSIDESTIRAAQFSAVKLKEMGYNEVQLKNCGFDCGDLKAANFNAVQLRCAGFTPSELKEGGFTCKEVFSAGFNLRRLRKAGFTAADLSHELHVSHIDLKYAGYTPTQLKSIGCLATDLRTAGCTVAELKELYTSDELKRAGYDKVELKPQGVWPHDGQWQIYNQYWNCCYGLDKQSIYCNPLRLPSTEGGKV